MAWASEGGAPKIAVGLGGAAPENSGIPEGEDPENAEGEVPRDSGGVPALRGAKPPHEEIYCGPLW